MVVEQANGEIMRVRLGTPPHGAETEEVLVLAALNENLQRDSRPAAEEEAAQALIGQYDRAVLLRAKALAVLRQRGEDVSRLVSGV